jgi:GNAT superfamily N-acetyltransferase
MNFIIRWFTKKDIKAILGLINELAIFEKEPKAVIINENYLLEHGFSESPSFKCLVSELNNEIVGIALFYNRFSTWKGVTIHLEDLIVKQDKRSLGIGKALYKKVLEYAITQKVKRVEWVVLNWNKNAIDFYKNSGAKVFDDWQTVQIDNKAIDKYLNK